MSDQQDRPEDDSYLALVTELLECLPGWPGYDRWKRRLAALAGPGSGDGGTCIECGVAGRYVHRYPKGEQPERSHPFLAAPQPLAGPGVDVERRVREAVFGNGPAFVVKGRKALDWNDTDEALTDLFAALPQPGEPT